MCHADNVSLLDPRVGVSEYIDIMRDISGRNIAFSCSNLLEAIENELMEVLGAPQVKQVARKDSKPLENSFPIQLVEAESWIG